MKKLYQTRHKREFNKKHARDQAERDLRSKVLRRRRRRLSQGAPRGLIRTGTHRAPHHGFERVFAPALFSFLDNPNGVVSFIQKLEYHFKNAQRVWVALKDVEQIDYSAIVVLLSVMVQFKSHNIEFNGDFPKSRKARALLIKSGFFSNLLRTFEVSERYHIAEDDSHRIHTHAWKNVDAALSAEIISSSSQQIWGSKKRCPGVQRAMVELMQNTNNHAEIGKTGEKHWWLSVHHPKNLHKVCFSFIDFGVGVFTSLDNKPIQSKFHKWKDKMKDRFQYGNNEDLLKLILAGELHRTATGMPYRGKGLPGIADANRRNQMSRLHIVTNNVYCSYDDNEYRQLRSSFSGTLVYWELTKHNDKLPDN